MSATVRFYDATLTRGLGQPGRALSPSQRQALARELDAGRVDYIEVAWWDASADRVAWTVTGLRPRHARPAMQVPLGSDAAANARRVQAAREADVPVLTLHIPAAVAPGAWRAALEQARAAQVEVLVVLEDFYRFQQQHPAAAWERVQAALQAGAHAVTLDDARGEALPWEMALLMHAAVRRFPAAVLGVSGGNANACADDNALVAVRQGARLVHGTLHGLGRGQGYADLGHVRATLFRERGPARDDEQTLRVLWEAGQTLDHWLYAPTRA